MGKIKRSFQLKAIVLGASLLYTGTQEASEYSLNYEKITIARPKTEDKNLLLLSEGFGHFVGKNLRNPGIAFDVDRFMKGLKEGVDGKPAPLSDERYMELMAYYEDKALNELSDKNLTDANAFLRENRRNRQVVEVEKDKLQYEILKKGTGDAVSYNSAPLIHYTGTLMDGTIFDTTELSGDPVIISLYHANPAFQKGLLGMRQGEIRKLFIHPDYGYGGYENLPPNTILIFDVEVLLPDTIRDRESSVALSSEVNNTTEPTVNANDQTDEDENDDDDSNTDKDEDPTGLFNDDFKLPDW